MIVRDEAWWRAALDYDFGSSMSDRRLAVLGDRAYAAFRVDDNWGDFGPEGELAAAELVAADPIAEAALWQFLASHDLITKLEVGSLPADHPMPFRLYDTETIKESVGDPFYLRLLDVPSALEARAYGTAGRLVLEVTDTFLPDNAGRWELVADAKGDAEGVACTPTDRPADITLDVSTLGSLYLGGVSAFRLADAGRIAASSDAALAQAQAMFASERAPWNVVSF